MNQKLFLKRLVLLLCFLLLTQFIYPDDKRPSTPRFSLKVTWGFGSNIPIGDVNDSLESFNNNEIFEMHRTYATGGVVGEIKTINGRISHWEAELRFHLTSRISFGMATSALIHKGNESSVTYTTLGWAEPQVMTWAFRPEIKVSYPIRLSVYYRLTVLPRLSISIGGGVGFYPAKILQLLRFEKITPTGQSSWSTQDQETRRNFALGFHGNAVIEYFLNNSLALVAEFQKRQIEIGGFKGTLKYMSSDDKANYERNGTLYYFTMLNYSIGTEHAALEIWPEPPEMDLRWITGLRKAVLDLSGYSFRIGIRIGLF